MLLLDYSLGTAVGQLPSLWTTQLWRRNAGGLSLRQVLTLLVT
jgi:hypothetical protein